jgi:hypothetical protein
MDLCGFQTLEKQRLVSRKAHPAPPKHRISRQRVIAKLVCLICMGLLAGCATTAKYGSPPRVDQLGTLKVGLSNKSGVLAVLGEPRGYGAIHLSVSPTSREIWFYEYSESVGTRVSLKFLMVFFDKDIYDGHLWFSSAQLLDTKE